MPELTIEEFKKQMQAREKITLTMLDNQTAEIMKDEALFKDLLDMLARHVTTSVSNTILAQAQLPDATAVTSIAEWEKRQVPVAKDENGYYPKGIYQITYDGQYADDSGNVHAKYKIYKKAINGTMKPSAIFSSPIYPISIGLKAPPATPITI